MSMAANDTDGRDDVIAGLTAENEKLREAGSVANEMLVILEEDELDVDALVECISANYSFLEELAGYACEPPDDEEE